MKCLVINKESGSELAIELKKMFNADNYHAFAVIHGTGKRPQKAYDLLSKESGHKRAIVWIQDSAGLPAGALSAEEAVVFEQINGYLIGFVNAARKEVVTKLMGKNLRILCIRSAFDKASKA